MVGMKYRNNQQIVESILSATKEVGMEGIPVTRLMQTSNLSYTRLGKFMSKLTGSGLINIIEYDGKNTFVITEKGRMYLQEYQKFLQMTETFGLDL
jgi:predicted transcriptional regulator